MIAAAYVLFVANHAQAQRKTETALGAKEQSIVSISSLTAKGDLERLKTALATGLEAGLTVNEIRETLVHLYAYCGFPRSIRGLQTFMAVLDERKAVGITDHIGRDASPVDETDGKYERGKKTLEKLTQTPQPETPIGYGAFAPVMDTFLKEHLFADIFDRDVLTYRERELATVSAIATIGRAEPMLRSHLAICLKLGLTPGQLQQFVRIIKYQIAIELHKTVRAARDRNDSGDCRIRTGRYTCLRSGEAAP